MRRNVESARHGQKLGLHQPNPDLPSGSRFDDSNFFVRTAVLKSSIGQPNEIVIGDTPIRIPYEIGG